MVAPQSDDHQSIVRGLLQPIVDEMLMLDTENALVTLSAWKDYFAALSSRARDMPKTIDEYIPFRLDDFGCNHWLAMLRFSMDLHLTEAELEESQPFVSVAMVSVVLTNDW